MLDVVLLTPQSQDGHFSFDSLALHSHRLGRLHDTSLCADCGVCSEVRFELCGLLFARHLAEDGREDAAQNEHRALEARLRTREKSRAAGKREQKQRREKSETSPNNKRHVLRLHAACPRN